MTETSYITIVDKFGYGVMAMLAFMLLWVCTVPILLTAGVEDDDMLDFDFWCFIAYAAISAMLSGWFMWKSFNLSRLRRIRFTEISKRYNEYMEFWSFQSGLMKLPHEDVQQLHNYNVLEVQQDLKAD